MSSRFHHTVLYSHTPDRLVRFLVEVAGMEVMQRFDVPGQTLTETLGWPASEGATAWMLGRPPAGMVEVLGVPESLNGQIRSGVAAVSFAVRDIEGVAAQVRGWPAPASDIANLASGDVQLDAMTCTVDGILIEFIRFPPS
jgi:catechol 2,3-dioxygenase-like lactoylglutathione lyase family enzyme